MKFARIFFVFIFLSSSSLILSKAFADTILLKNEKELKGLVVERHADRIILSTEKGEIPILLSGIKKIQYVDPEQNYMEVGRAYEAESKYGEALAFYEKALEANPNFDEAKKAAAAMKSRFWAATTEGPQSEMDKQQDIYDSWGGASAKPAAKKIASPNLKSIRQNLGLVFTKKGDWVYVDEAHPKSDSAAAGLKPGDRLVSLDTESLRYLGIEVVAKKMIDPRYSSFVLEYERDCRLTQGANTGLKLKMDNQGVRVGRVEKSGAAAQAGIKEGDLVVRVNGEPTRYTPLGKVMGAMRGGAEISVRRSAMLSRK